MACHVTALHCEYICLFLELNMVWNFKWKRCSYFHLLLKYFHCHWGVISKFSADLLAFEIQCVIYTKSLIWKVKTCIPYFSAPKSFLLFFLIIILFCLNIITFSTIYGEHHQQMKFCAGCCRDKNINKTLVRLCSVCSAYLEDKRMNCLWSFNIINNVHCLIFNQLNKVVFYSISLYTF